MICKYISILFLKAKQFLIFQAKDLKLRMSTKYSLGIFGLRLMIKMFYGSFTKIHSCKFLCLTHHILTKISYTRNSICLLKLLDFHLRALIIRIFNRSIYSFIFFKNRQVNSKTNYNNSLKTKINPL